MLPFVVGGLVAWGVLPLVDALDRIMARPLAAILSVLSVVAVMGAVIVIIVPALASALVEFAHQIPGQQQINDELSVLLANMPQETRDIVGPILIAVASVANDTLSNSSSSIHDLVAAAIQAAPQIASTILGLVVLPTWIVTVMTSNRRTQLAIDSRLADWIRPDFWAVARLLDRSVKTFVRGYVAVAAAVALLTYMGVAASPSLGGPTFGAPLALATFAGVVQLIPELGPILGLLPALLIVAVDPQRAGLYILIYVIARMVGSRVVEGKVARDPSQLHRAIVIPGVVILSQLGPLAPLLSAPLLSFGSDFVRYVHGRLSEPARPVGLLPGETIPARYYARPPVVLPPPVYRRAPRPVSPPPATTQVSATR